MKESKKILITGVSGYCGSFLAGHFSNRGIPVVGIDVKPEPGAGDRGPFEFRKADVRDRRALRDVFKAQQPSHVIHLAYVLGPIRDRQLEYEVDVLGSRNVMEAAHEAPSVKQFVFMSSVSVYGAHADNPAWIREEDALRPNDYAYAVYKKEAETYCAGFEKRPDMKLVVLRMGVVAGPRCVKLGGVISDVSNAPFLFSIIGGDDRVQFIHEDDVIGLVERVVHDEAIEGVFNLSPDGFTTARELAGEMKKPLIPVPLFLLESLFRLLWHARLASLPPAFARLLAFGIIASPHKIVRRYGYSFRYSSKSAFLDAVEKRRRKGTL